MRSVSSEVKPGAGQNSPKKGVYTVLVVDDSVFVTKQITQILTSEGFNVIGTAEDGEDAIAKYHQLKPDIVTMDITMPKMDGVTALQKIVESDPSAKIVMVSALGKQEMVKRSLMSGAKNYIVKPLDRKKVLERIHSIL